MNLRYIDWVWHVRGSIELVPGQSRDEAFARLEPVFEQTGTSHDRSGDTLSFRKKDPAAQDPLAIFNTGTLHIEGDTAAPLLRYHLISRSLLACFLAPLLFLGAAQLTIALNKLDKPAASKDAEAKKKPEKISVLHPIDKALGAPEPDKPKKKDAKKKEDSDDKKPKPTPAYVFAGIFAALYVIGRLLEAWLVQRLFRKQLAGS